MSMGNDDYEQLLEKIANDIRVEEDRRFIEQVMRMIPIEFDLTPRDINLNEFLCS